MLWRMMVCVLLVFGMLATHVAAAPALVEEPLGTLKVDAVELIAGREATGQENLAFEYEHYRYLFATEANLKAFQANPAKYQIQLGGACGSMGVLSGRGTPDLHGVYDGKIYIFASAGCRSRFLGDPERLLQEPDAAPTATAETRAAGAKLLRQVVEAAGGAEAVDGVRNFRLTFKKSVESGGQTYAYAESTLIALPVDIKQTVSWNETSWDSVTTAGAGHFQSSRGSEWMAPVQRDALRRSLRNHNLLGILANRKADDFVAVAAGEAKVGETPVQLLTVFFDQTTSTLAVDPASGRVLQISYRGPGPGAVIGTLTYTYSDFAAVGALMLPRKASVTFDGETFSSPAYSDATLAINEDVPADTFTRPEK